jgi:hypothetical protein
VADWPTLDEANAAKQRTVANGRKKEVFMASEIVACRTWYSVLSTQHEVHFTLSVGVAADYLGRP